jgi:glyoxylase-like metal-dependent hydrolase (beta-lactamase superfamily II)
MNRIITLSIEMNFGAVKDTINPAVLCDSSHRVLVDCGYIGSLPKIEQALQENDIAPESVTHIILTHQDHDHVGAAAAYKKKYPDVTVMASAVEAPYISGAAKSLRLAQAEQLQKTLPPEQQAFGEAFCSLLRSIEPVHIDCPLNAEDLLPFCGGCQVLATPGHTPGHISLFLPELETVIPGDAMASENGKPVIANPQFTLDVEKAAASFERLMSLNAKTIICYHGGALCIDEYSTINPASFNRKL